MSRALLVVAGVLLAACGTESTKRTPSGGSNEPDARSFPGGVPMAALLPTTRNVKVALKTTADVDSVVYDVVDNGDDSPAPVACAADGDCSGYPGATCKSNQCTTTTRMTYIFYVRNESLDPSSVATVGVPCNGGEYVVEIYGASAAEGNIYPITERHVSVPFTMAEDCTTTPTDVWTNGPTFPSPSLAFPTIYQAGLGAPYDTYTVNVSSFPYPWTGPWTLTNPAAPIRYGGASATFAAPAGTGAITFNGRFHLDHSLLVAGEALNAWELRTFTTTQAPIVRVANLTVP